MKRKTGKCPEGWPNVSKAQQEEGLRFVLQVIPVRVFCQILNKIPRVSWFTNSHKNRLKKRARKIDKQDRKQS